MEKKIFKKELKGQNLKKRGQVVMLTTIFFLVVSSTVVFGFAAPALRHTKVANDLGRSRSSFYLAESGVEDVLYRLKTSLPTYPTQTLSLDGFTATTEIADSSGGKIITAEGDWADRFRKVRAQVLAGVGVSFNYGLQSGNGGLVMSNNSGVNGNVYSNGDITGSSGAFVTGTAVAANSISQATDQANNTPIPSPNSVNFRNTSSAQDFAQSFQVSITSPINKVQLYMKKVGSPANATVLITNNSASNLPGTTVLASGTLSASNVTTNYGWADVTFTTNPDLDPGTTYWIVVNNGSQSSSNYYNIAANDAYASGTGKTGQYGGTWVNTSPVTYDGYFTVILGGLTSQISNVTVGSSGSGDAWANTVTGSTVAGALYCTNGSGNNKACNTSRGDPPPVSMPVSEANIDQWKNEAAAGGTINGDYTPTGSFSSLGPKKINGNLNIGLGHTFTLTGTLWVTGNISLGNNAIVQLDSGYGANSGAIVADGRISLSNNIQFQGSGQTGSFVMLLTTSDCPTSSSCGGANAVSVSNNGGAIIINAQNGTVSLSNNAGAKEITADKIVFGNNATVTYESGLVNVNFSSGPGGAWNVSNWREVE